MRKLRALIVDDEYPARKELRRLLASFPEVEVVGEATHAEEARQLCLALKYDLLFLDIQMPGLSGIELARELQKLSPRPRVIFTTAYQEFALDAFRVGAVDYLLKPFDEDRLAEALGRIGPAPSAPSAAPAGPATARRAPRPDRAPAPFRDAGVSREPPRYRAPADRIAVERADKIAVIDVRNIVFIYALNEEVYVKLPRERLLARQTLRELEEQLVPFDFVRTHRRFLVNLRKVREVIPYFKGHLRLAVDDEERTEIPVSRTLAAEVKQRLGLNGRRERTGRQS